jgi:hypothetical protein
VRTAVVSIKDHRSAALVTQLLLAAQVEVKSGLAAGPGNADIWVTNATPKALVTAAHWKKKVKGRTVVALGELRKASLAKWNAIGALHVSSIRDFDVLRYSLGLATGA